MMARQRTCRVCGAVFDVPDPEKRRRGRLPHWCSAGCKRQGKRQWNAENRWRYRPAWSLVELMENGRRGPGGRGRVKSSEGPDSPDRRLSHPAIFFPAGEVFEAGLSASRQAALRSPETPRQATENTTENGMPADAAASANAVSAAVAELFPEGSAGDE